MSRTARSQPSSKYLLRRPSGKKQAIVRGARQKAVPPTAWDDKLVGRDVVQQANRRKRGT